MDVSVVATMVAPLFVPADRPTLFVKAAETACEAIILDLEDAVAAADKATARAALDTGFTKKPVVIRINGFGTPWYEEDLAALAHFTVAAVIVPKAETCEDLARVAAFYPVIALMETVRGIANVRALAGSGLVRRLAFGSIDYAADLGSAHNRIALASARAEVVFASRLAGLPAPIDGVTVNIDDVQATASDAVYARSLGFGGKLAIHPRQIEAIQAGFAPDATETAWARRILASGDGAVKVDGAMVDEPVRIRARAVLARCRVSDTSA